MRFLEISEMEDGRPQVVGRLMEDGSFVGDGPWRTMIGRLKGLTLEEARSRTNSGYVVSRILDTGDRP